MVIWDVFFLDAAEQLGFPSTWPCCRQGSARQPFCPTLEGSTWVCSASRTGTAYVGAGALAHAVLPDPKKSCSLTEH